MKNEKKFAVIQYWNDNEKSEKSEKKVNENCYLISTKKNEIKYIKDLKEFNPNEDRATLCRMRISFKRNDYEIINPINEQKININKIDKYYLDDKIWHSVNQIYRLNENDIIKFGKNKKYNILKMNFSFEGDKEKIKDDNFNKNNNINYISIINKNAKPIFNIDIKANQYKINSYKNYEKINKSKNDEESKNETFPESKNKISRIEIKNETIKKRKDECWLCNDSYSDEDNPLICLCNCNKYIHYKCLKDNLANEISLKENLKHTVKKYISKNFNCKECLKPYHFRFRIPELDKIYEIIDLNLPKEEDYICLESLDCIIEDKETKVKRNIKTIYIVELYGQDINIGRQFYNDIIDDDISISKEHAVLKYNKKNGDLFLEDKNSRNGTFILVRGNIKIKEKNFLQIGKVNFSIEVKDKKSSIYE